jgi:hypothetical protein
MVHAQPDGARRSGAERVERQEQEQQQQYNQIGAASRTGSARGVGLDGPLYLRGAIDGVAGDDSLAALVEPTPAPSALSGNSKHDCIAINNHPPPS